MLKDQHKCSFAGRFCQYDYGKQLNLRVYGSKQPPDYNMTKVTVPVAYFYSKHDAVVAKEDQVHSLNLFQNIVDSYEIPYKNLTHIGFLLANDIAHLAYERAIELMENF